MDPSQSIKQLLEAAATTIHSDSPRLDAELLLAHALERPRSYLYTWPERSLSRDQYEQFASLIDRRAKGEPVAYLLGQREFWSLSLAVNPSVLIPRPETELLIETIIALPLPDQARVLDMGTGSGAIALALASEKQDWKITATDISSDALNTGKSNAQSLRLTDVEFLLSDWFTQLKNAEFDVIVSNPPYIPESDPHLSSGDVQHEPRSALASGDDGLTDLRQLIANAPEHLKPGGYLIVEHGYDQGAAAAALFADRGFVSISSLKDLSGHSRATLGRYLGHLL